MSLGILLLSTDLKLAKDLQAAARLCRESYTVYPCPNSQKFMESGLKYKINVVLIDENFSSTVALDWVDKLRSALSKELGNNKAPFFLLSGEKNLEDIRNALLQGYTDIFIKPIDISMLLQKLHIYLPDAKLLKDDLLFSMNVNDDVQIAISGKVVKASEYGATIETDKSFEKGEIYTLIAPMLAPDESPTPGLSLVRVLSSEPVNRGGNYLTTFTFLGPPKGMLTAVRIWLKKQYIKSYNDRERVN